MANEVNDYLTGLYNRKGMLKDAVAKEGDAIRLGGDEFVIMIPGRKEKGVIQALAEGLMQRVRAEGQYRRVFEIISISMGIVWDAKVEDGIDQLLSYSDAVMYFAKESGKGRYIFFDEYAERIRLEREMENTAEEAIKTGRFKLMYYPVMHLQNTRLVFTFARTVWEAGDGRLWYRSDFEHILEKSDLLKKIDLNSFEQLCKACQELYNSGEKKLVMGIKLSHVLLDDEVVELLDPFIDRYQVRKKDIEIFVDEKMFGRRSTGRLLSNLNKLKENGYKIGITNFGADFSSFRYLDSLPVSTIVFNKDYLDEDVQDRSGKGVLHTLFYLTKNMNFISVALGVDTVEEVEYLIKYGCDGASGSFFTEPLSLEAFKTFLSKCEAKEDVHIYDFKQQLCTTKGEFRGRIQGEGVQYISGICDRFGGLRFSGGEVGKNLVEFPGGLFSEKSFTISLWVRPGKAQAWVSAFYARMLN